MDMKDLSGLLQQAKEMHSNMAKLQAEAAAIEVEGQSGGGLVRVTANGAMDIRRVVIDPSLITSGDKEMLEDLICAAANDALRKSRQTLEAEMRKLTGGISIPGLF